MEIRKYFNQNNEKINFKLFDSRGIEPSNYNIKNASDDIINFITEKNKSQNPNEYIHCIWFCITGSSFLKEEEDFINILREVYSSDEYLPVTIVHTKAINEEEIENMEKLLISEKKLTDCYIPIVAKDIKIGKSAIIEKKGLDELINKTKKKIEEGKKSSYYGNLIKRFKNIIENKIIIEPFEKSIKEPFIKFEDFLYEHKKTILYNIFGDEGIEKCLEQFKQCFWEILDNFSITKQNLDRNDVNNRNNILNLFNLISTQIESQFKFIDKRSFEILIDQLILKICDEKLKQERVLGLEEEKKEKYIKGFNKYMKENLVKTRKGVIATFTIDTIIKDFFIGIIKERKDILEKLLQTKFKEDLIKLVEKTIKETH